MMINLEQWLQDIGCGDYISAFRESGVTADLLTELTDSDLKELGLTLGDRKRVMRAIAELGDTPTAAPGRPQRSAGTPNAERRQLTVMFIDLIGSTAFANRMDPEVWSEVIREYQNAVAGVVTRFGGYIAQYLGDGILCYFGWPQAHEDSVQRAVNAGLEINAAVSRVTADGQALSCRVGAATGLVVVGELIGQGRSLENIAIGDTPNLAARLQEAAKVGQVVISESTRRLLGSDFAIEELGAREFKGIEGPQTIYAVTGRAAAKDRYMSRAGATFGEMIGRDQELALLIDRWEQSVGGDGQAVMLVGEAGIGKSRISRALLEAVPRDRFKRLRYQCSPYHTDTALWPVIHHIRAETDLDSLDSNDARLDRLEEVLAEAGITSNQTRGLFGELLGIDVEERYGRIALSPSARRAAMFAAMSEFITGLARQRPLLVMIEDVHWCDPTTLEMISTILDHMPQEQVMLLITSRPENRPKFLPHPHFTTLTLNRLTRTGVEEIVTRLGGAKLPPETISAIIERTDGVPLFVEELTKALLELGEVAVPASLHDTLMARLDRLPEVKEIAQIASVMGREFEVDPLAQIASLSQQRVVAALDNLRQVELVFPRGGKFGRYIFKHALVRDAAYQSLLNRRRQEIHGRILEVLRENELTTPGILAHHAAEAGRLADAVQFGRLAAEDALRRPAYAEAITHLETALGVLGLHEGNEAIWRERVKLLLLSGEARIAHNGYAAESTVETFAEVEEIARRIGDKVMLIRGLYGRWAGHYVPGKNPVAMALADEILTVSQQTDDTLARALGHRLRGTVLAMTGQVGEAMEALDQAAVHYDADSHARHAARFGQDVGIAVGCYRLGVLCVTGHLDQAADLARKLLDEIETLDHVHTTAYATGHLACFLCASEIEPLGTEVANRCIALAERHRLPLWTALGHASRSMAQVYAGRAEAALPEFRNALDTLRRLKFEVFRPLLLPSFAMAEAQSGDLKGARSHVAEARRLVAEQQAHFAEPEILRAEGRIALLEDQPAQARAAFEEALATASRLGHLTWELRAAEDRAALLSEAGEAEAARAILAPVLARFEEGAELTSIRRARDALAATG